MYVKRNIEDAISMLEDDINRETKDELKKLLNEDSSLSQDVQPPYNWSKK